MPSDAKRGTDLEIVIARKNPLSPKPLELELWATKRPQSTERKASKGDPRRDEVAQLPRIKENSTVLNSSRGVENGRAPVTCAYRNLA
ncbi:Cadherin-86C [Eumeta japonica]|uniref:Cadherin-86C n=1 Tax=Eumeta variegata TaxID=151549 RepID=A0A4C2A6C0_EUMVA|nr:Cadherin-86C [Eumeta japonica]